MVSTSEETQKKGCVEYAGLVFLFIPLLFSSFFFFTLSASAATLSRPVNNLGIILHLPFNEGTGTHVGDVSGSGNNGTVVNGPSWSPVGKFGPGLLMTGTQSVELLGSNVFLPTSNQPFTISAWVRPSAISSGSHRLITLRRNVNNSAVLFAFVLENKLRLNLIENSSISTSLTSNTDFSTDTWYHVVATYDGTDAALYVNGVLDISAPSGLSTASGSSQGIALVGSGVSGDRFQGILDEFKFYHRALSAAEVRALYGQGQTTISQSLSPTTLNTSSTVLSQGSSLTEGLVGHWTFDGSDVTDKVYDRSGQGNHGYFFGGATSTAKVIGKIGQGFNFKSTNSQFISIPDSESLDVTAGLTASAWVKFTSLSSPRVIFGSYDYPNGQRSWSLFYDSAGGNLKFRASSNGVNVADKNLPFSTVDQWVHVTVSFTAGAVIFYLNGVEQASTGSAPSGVLYDSQGPFLIGASGNNTVNTSYMLGSIDDVRVYNRILSAGEVQQLYNLSK